MEAICFALLFADRVITENNGKKGIIGTFSAFNFPSFPSVPPPWFIFLGITNIVGQHEFTLNLVRDDAQEVVLPISGQFTIAEKGSDAEIIIPVFNSRFQKPGIYTLTANVDGQQLASRMLTIKKVDLKNNPNQNLNN